MLENHLISDHVPIQYNLTDGVVQMRQPTTFRKWKWYASNKEELANNLARNVNMEKNITVTHLIKVVTNTCNKKLKKKISTATLVSQITGGHKVLYQQERSA